MKTMKQVYDCEQFISLGTEAEFRHTSIWDHLHLLDAEEALNRTNRTYYKNFEDFFEACQEGLVRNADAYLGLFNCTICLPQIVAAVIGGAVLNYICCGSQVGMLAAAGVLLILGAASVIFIKEGKK